MKPNGITNLIKPKMLAPAFFVGIGGCKMYKDYQSAKPEKKSRVFTKDSVILTSSAIGYGLSTAVLKRIPNVPIVDKFVLGATKLLGRIAQKTFIKEKVTPGLQKYLKPLNKTPQLMHQSFNHIERAVKDCFSATLITSASIAAAFGGNAVVSKYIYKKQNEEEKKTVKDGIELPKVPEKTDAKITDELSLSEAEPLIQEEVESLGKSKSSYNYLEYLGKEFSKDPANKAFASVSFLPVMRALDFPMTAIQGFEISREKDTAEKIKRTSYSLIANTFVPTFFISISTALTRRFKDYVRFPIIAASTLLGIAAGAVAGKYAEKELDSMNFK